MADRDSNQVQLDFPQLTADIIAALRLTGTLGLFNMSDTVIPTISVGNVRPQTVVLNPVVFESAEIFSLEVNNPAINSVLVDTGPLPAGIYDMFYGLSYTGVGVNSNVELQWRNAANAANLAFWPTSCSNLTPVANSAPMGPFSLNIGLNERIRSQLLVGGGSGRFSVWLQLALRPTP